MLRPIEEHEKYLSKLIASREKYFSSSKLLEQEFGRFSTLNPSSDIIVVNKCFFFQHQRAKDESSKKTDSGSSIQSQDIKLDPKNGNELQYLTIIFKERQTIKDLSKCYEAYEIYFGNVFLKDSLLIRKQEVKSYLYRIVPGVGSDFRPM